MSRFSTCSSSEITLQPPQSPPPSSLKTQDLVFAPREAATSLCEKENLKLQMHEDNVFTFKTHVLLSFMKLNVQRLIFQALSFTFLLFYIPSYLAQKAEGTKFASRAKGAHVQLPFTAFQCAWTSKRISYKNDRVISN